MITLFLVDAGKNIRIVQQPDPYPDLESTLPKGAMGEEKQLERVGVYFIFTYRLPALDMIWGGNRFIRNHAILHPVFGMN